MPSLPLALQILGGLGGLGADAGTGAFTGLAQGMDLSSVLQSREADTRLRNLQALREQMTMGQPQQHVVGNRVITVGPNGQILGISDLPAAPPTAQQEAATEASRATTAWRQKQIATEGQGRRVPPIDQYIELLRQGNQEGAAKLLSDVSAWEQGTVKPTRGSDKDRELADWLETNKLPDTPENRERGRKALRSESIDEQVRKTTTALQATIPLHEASTDRILDRREAQKKREEDRKKQGMFASTLTNLNQIVALLPEMNRRGFLAKDESVQSYWVAEAARSKYVPGIGRPGDPVLRQFLQHSSSMVQTARAVGDIGARAREAYESFVAVIKEPATEEAVRLASQNLRDAVVAYRDGKEIEYEAAGPSGVLQPKGTGGGAAGGRIRVIGPNGEKGTVPRGTDLSQHPGWKVVP